MYLDQDNVRHFFSNEITEVALWSNEWDDNVLARVSHLVCTLTQLNKVLLKIVKVSLIEVTTSIFVVHGIDWLVEITGFLTLLAVQFVVTINHWPTLRDKVVRIECLTSAWIPVQKNYFASFSIFSLRRYIEMETGHLNPLKCFSIYFNFLIYTKYLMQLFKLFVTREIMILYSERVWLIFN